MTSKMEFDCKLAHSDQIKRVSNFKSIKELYELAAKLFQIPVDEILYCTLNTHNFRDMDAILGNYLSYGDQIVVHVCGQTKELHLTKTQEYLGLTITDNGHGRAFVKRVKSDQQVVEKNIKQGDHIAAINSESTVGLRHYEVAKAIREVPKGTNFTIRLVEPKYLDSYLKAPSCNNLKESDELVRPLDCALEQLTNNKSSLIDNLLIERPRADSSLSGDSFNCDELIHSSLPIERLLSKQTAANGELNEQERSQNFAAYHHEINHENVPSQQQPTGNSYKAKIDKIDSILESFLGINDDLLAIQIYRLARENKDSYYQFHEAIQTSELSAFNFNDDMKRLLWTSAVVQ